MKLAYGHAKAALPLGRKGGGVYSPAFDTSTLYYAEKALYYLADPPHFNSQAILAGMRHLARLTSKHPGEDYLNLNRAFAEFCGVTEIRPGVFAMPRQDDYDNTGGKLLIRFVFGVLCLA